MMISHNMEQTIGKTNQKVVGRGYERNPQNGMVQQREGKKPRKSNLDNFMLVLQL